MDDADFISENKSAGILCYEYDQNVYYKYTFYLVRNTNITTELTV